MCIWLYNGYRWNCLSAYTLRISEAERKILWEIFRLFLTGNVSWHGWLLLLLPRVYVHISTDQIRHLVLLLNSSSSRLDYYTCRAWQDFWMSLAITGQPRWCDTPPEFTANVQHNRTKTWFWRFQNVRQKFWFHKIISKKKTIFIENLSWTDVFYL